MPSISTLMAAGLLFSLNYPVRADITRTFRINTTSLVGHSAGPFSLAFQLTDGAGSGNASNSATIRGLTVTGGSLSGNQDNFGGVTGTVGSTLTLRDSQLVNYVTQRFSPGTQVSFEVTVSTNVESGEVPDQFTFAVLDRTATELPTLSGAGLDVLVSVDLKPDAAFETFGGDATRAPSAGGNPLVTFGAASEGLRFVPIPPCRLLETRSAYSGTTWSGALGPPALTANSTRTIPVRYSTNCVIPPHAQAYVFNVTLDTVEASSGPVDFVTIFPTGESRPNYWTARTTTGGYIANAAIVKAGNNGSVDVYTSHNVHLLLDINGYFTAEPSAGGLLYYPVGPCRSVDTRGPIYSLLPAPYGNQRFTTGETRTLRIPGSPGGGCQIPAASAYSMQMTLAPGELTNGPPVAFVTLWPAGQAQPSISNMNSLFGYALANSGIVPARPSDGSINVFTYNPTNLILDVNGYFAPDDGSGRGLLYFPITQCRMLNTQDTGLSGAFGGPRLTPDVDRTVPVLSSTRCPGLPSTARAFALNATAIPQGNPMPFLSMWPSGTGWPNVSQLNAFQGQTVSNFAIVPASPQGAIDVRVNAMTHAAIEVAGYFSR